MKKIFKILTIMCTFVLGLQTQTKAQTLSSFMPEKTGLDNYTPEQFNAEISKLTDQQVVYYYGVPLRESAERTKVPNTQYYVIDYIDEYAFSDPAFVRHMLNTVFLGSRPLSGSVSTRGINKKTLGYEDLTRPAYVNELPFMLDWDAATYFSDQENAINFGSVDIKQEEFASAKCGNPLSKPRINNYASRNYEGYARVPDQIAEAAPKIQEPEFQPEVSEQQSGNTYIENNYFTETGEVDYSQDEYGEYRDSRVNWWIGLNISVGPLYANTHCGGYSGNYYYVGHNNGYCPHGQSYQQFGYQNYGGYPTVYIYNSSVFNQVVNNTYYNYYTYNNQTITYINNPTPPNPGNPGNPNDPTNGDDDPIDPVDPHNKPVKSNNGFAQGNGNGQVNQPPGKPMASGYGKKPTVKGGSKTPKSTEGTNYQSPGRPNPYDQPEKDVATAISPGRPSYSQPKNETINPHQSIGRPSHEPKNNTVNAPPSSNPKGNNNPKGENYNQSRPLKNPQGNGSYSNSKPNPKQNYGNGGNGSKPPKDVRSVQQSKPQQQQMAYTPPKNNGGGRPSGGQGGAPKGGGGSSRPPASSRR